MPARTTRATAAETQKSRCQSPTCTIQADSGRPMAPPTPSVALIAATDDPARCGGTISRSSAMPTGMKPIARPWSARPTSIVARDSASAQTTEPATSSRVLATRMRCLPSMSANRPETGIVTAPASRVMVTTQAVFAAVLSSRRGSSPWIGMTIVWVSEAARPPAHRATTAARGREAGAGTGP